ncbi:hypothetical protein V6N13_147358 [Hibiscus sabdariffa]
MVDELGIANKKGKNSELMKVNVGGHDAVLKKNMKFGLDRLVEAKVAECQDKGPTSQQLNPYTNPTEDVADY